MSTNRLIWQIKPGNLITVFWFGAGCCHFQLKSCFRGLKNLLATFGGEVVKAYQLCFQIAYLLAG